MPDLFTGNVIENIVALNKLIVERRDEPFGLDDTEVFYGTFRNVNEFNSIPDPRIRIIKKASTLLSGLVWVNLSKMVTKQPLQQSLNIFYKKMDLILNSQIREKNKSISNC
jgi:hypothetical protein